MKARNCLFVSSAKSTTAFLTKTSIKMMKQVAVKAAFFADLFEMVSKGLKAKFHVNVMVKVVEN